MLRDRCTCKCCGALGYDPHCPDNEEEERHHWTTFHWTIKDDSILVPLDAHHITDRSEMPNGGYVHENGIALCPECHIKAEKFHQTNGQDWEQGFHPNDLYLKIGSSHKKAYVASERLSA